VLFALAAAVVAACGGGETIATEPPSAAVPCGSGAAPKPIRLQFGRLSATVETDPVPSSGDAADDVVVWVHPSDPGRSVVIGTDKKSGIGVYDLSGRELSYREGGKPNNVDLRCGFRLRDRSVALVTAGDRERNEILVYRLDPATRTLVDVAARPISPGLDIYGSCMYRSRTTGNVFVIATSEDGEIEQWRLFADRQGLVDAERVRRFDVGSQTEGCVADDALGRLYLGEEERGIWRYQAEPAGGSRRTLVDATGRGGHLDADVEGLTILAGPRGAGYLVASSQGDSSFAVYRREGRNAYVGRFRIVGHGPVDAVEGTDGIDAVAAPLGPRFPNGLLVVQDGDNDDGNQNFKLIPLRSAD
jgi:3-phytase